MNDLKLKQQEIVLKMLTQAKLAIAFQEVIDKFRAFTSKFRGKHDRENYQKLLHHMENATSINFLDEFEKVFTSVHPGFYSQLTQKYPDLTQREMLFCAFIRLNMKSKDIAIITDVSIKSLEVARHRIRKKMKLSRHQNLAAELMKV